MSERIKESLPLGVILERRSIENRWVHERWTPIAVIPGAPALDAKGDWKEIERGEGWEYYHAGTLELDLFRKETEGYKVNLNQHPPKIFVVLRPLVESPHDLTPFLVTACPFEAQKYLVGGEDEVEAVTMPDGLVAFVREFVDRHHVEEPFYKRKRKAHDPRKGSPAGQPKAASKAAPTTRE